MSFGITSATAQCKNHPEVPAVDRCAGCAETFCFNCLVEVQGRKYCAACKMMALKGQPMIETASVPCKEATEGLVAATIGIGALLIMAILGFFTIWFFVLELYAISRAFTARKLIAANPNLTGAGKANAALITGILTLIMYVICFIVGAAGGS